MNEEFISYKIRKTSSWAYSIDKYEKWELIETISQNNIFDQSNENQLNQFSEEIVLWFIERKEIIKDQNFIDKLREKYNDFYWIVEFFDNNEDWDDLFWNDDLFSELFSWWEEELENDESRREVIIWLVKWLKREFEDWSWFEIANNYSIKKDVYKEKMSIEEFNQFVDELKISEISKLSKIKYWPNKTIIAINWKEDFDRDSVILIQS